MHTQAHGAARTLIAAAALTASTANAGVIQPGIAQGIYELSNHPDGSQQQPGYGLRLDELFDETAGHDVFTFDFDHPQSNMTLELTATTIHISGDVWGGRDTGESHANDQYLGLYSIDFTYDIGVMQATPDNDYVVDAMSQSNSGAITTPVLDGMLNPIVINLLDERGSNPFSFRFGDEDDDQGHRGAAGVFSGWGWLTHFPEGQDPGPFVPQSDWLFTATFLVPSSGTTAIAGAALALAASRRRRS